MKIFFYILMSFLLSGCAIWKSSLVSNGNREDAIQNAICDFINTSTLSKPDSVFSISIKEFSDDILGVSIYGSTETLLVVKDGNTINYSGLPNRYTEKKGKLFYWHDSTKTVTPDVINILKRYNQIDTMILNVYIPERHIDDAKKGMDYYFCKKNLLKYKKIKTNQAMGYYAPPKIDCK